MTTTPLESAIEQELERIAKDTGKAVADLTVEEVVQAGNAAQARLLDKALGNVGLTVEDIAGATPVATADDPPAPTRDLTRRPDDETT